MPVAESDLQRAILARISIIPGCFFWRQNVGAAQLGNRYVAFGIRGQADISGLIEPHGRRVEIEVKSATGRQSADQAEFQKRIESNGGLYILARTVDEAVDAVLAARCSAGDDLLSSLEECATSRTATGLCWCGLRDSQERSGVAHIPSCQRARAAITGARKEHA
jgi:hypothetical protein